MNTTTTTTATAPSGQVYEVTISETGTVRTLFVNVFLGDVDGMTRLGWEFGA